MSLSDLIVAWHNPYTQVNTSQSEYMYDNSDHFDYLLKQHLYYASRYDKIRHIYNDNTIVKLINKSSHISYESIRRVTIFCKREFWNSSFMS